MKEEKKKIISRLPASALPLAEARGEAGRNIKAFKGSGAKRKVLLVVTGWDEHRIELAGQS